DYCLTLRNDGTPDIGALELIGGMTCDTTRPPNNGGPPTMMDLGPTDMGDMGRPDQGPTDANSYMVVTATRPDTASDTATDTSGDVPADTAADGTSSDTTADAQGDDGCGCSLRTAPTSRQFAWPFVLLVLGALITWRRRR